MTSDIKIFLQLLRSGLYGTPIPESELPKQIDWKAITALAKKHVVLGIIIESIQFLPEQLRPAGPIATKLNKFALGLIRTNMILDKSVAKLVSVLGENGVNGVLLKGQGVARYYRLPQMRQSGDIDFYVGKQQYAKAIDICTNLLSTDKKGSHATMQHFGFNMDGVEVELHRLAAMMYSPVGNSRFQKWIVEELENSNKKRILTINNTKVILPSYDFNALYIFYHAWYHFIFGGIGLRQLCDWVMIFHSHAGDIDRERLIHNLRRFGLTKAWKLFACIAVNYLGVSNDRIPLYDPAFSGKAEKVLEDIIEGGNFGYHSEANAEFMAGKHGFRDEVRKVRTISRYFLTLFPIIPAEATVMFANRMFSGTLDTIKRVMSHES